MRKRHPKPVRPYDPFAFDARPVKRVHVAWEVVEQDDSTFAFQALAMFRRTFPDLGTLTADRLTWGYAWTEEPVLLDMSRPADSRRETRSRAVKLVVVFCRHEDKVAYSRDLPGPSASVMGAIEDEEVARRSEVDWMHQGE